MALSAEVVPTIRPAPQGQFVYPTGIQSDWSVACDAPETAEADSGVVVAAKVVKPGAIVRAAQRYVRNPGKATALAVALRYDVGISSETSPVVRVFGRDHNGVWHVLQDNNGSTEVTITMALTTDVISTDGLYKITTPKFFDLDGSDLVIVAVQTAFNGTGTKTNSDLIVKML